MKKLVDLHTHLETLAEVFQLRSRLQDHVCSLRAHIKKDHKIILSVAMYVQFYQKYDDLIQLIKNFKNEIRQIEGVKLILNKDDLTADFSVGIILHIESARTLKDLDQLDELHELGIRGVIPVHFHNNKIGQSCDDLARRFQLRKNDPGLSEFGIEFVKACNQKNIWLDLAHATDHTAEMILEHAKHVMVSHVGIRDLVGSKRNLPIKTLKKVAEKDGLIGLIPWKHLIGDEGNAYQKQIEFALEHNLAKALCIGSDLGAPIATHENYRSLFDLEKAVNEFPDIAQDMKWNNALNFFKKSL